MDDGYVRKIPIDPMTGSDSTWVEEQAASDEAEGADPTQTSGGINDVHSGSEGSALDGSRYADW